MRGGWSFASDARRRRRPTPWRRSASRGANRIRFDDGKSFSPQARARLLKAVDLARAWLEELLAGTIDDIPALARREQKSERSIRMTLSLAFLDPAIVAAGKQGKLPRGSGVSRLVDLPPAFADQWVALGLTRPQG